MKININYFFFPFLASGREKILEKNALENLLTVLDKPLNDDIMDSLLELFGNLCENGKFINSLSFFFF